MAERNIIDEVTGNDIVSLDDLASQTDKPKVIIPDLASKNNAATISLLSDNLEAMQSDYQSIILEAANREDFTEKRLIQPATQKQVSEDKEGIMSILADPNFTLEQKKAAILSYNQSERDVASLVVNKALRLPEENVSEERKDVRIIGAEQFRAFHEFEQARQDIFNRHAATLTQDNRDTFADFLGVIAPFATNVHSAKTITKALEQLKSSKNAVSASVFVGSAVQEIRDTIAAMSLDKQLEAIQLLMPIIENNSGIIPGTKNNFRQMQDVQALLAGDYTAFDKALDNISGFLDVIGLGGMFKNPAKAARRLLQRDAATEESKFSVRSIGNQTAPVSPINVVKEGSQQRAKGMYDMIVQSQGDEAANALAGTSRENAIVGQTVNQPLVKDGSVESKVIQPDSNLNEIRVVSPDKDVVEALYNTGGIHLTQGERIRAFSNIVNDLKNVKGVTLHENLSSVGLEGDRAVIKATFGNKEGGYINANEAITQAKFAFKEYGVTEKDLTLLKKVEGEYVPVKMEEAAGEGDFLVQVNVDHRLNPTDVVEMDKLDVKRNFFDRIPVFRSKNSGSIARHILDAASMLHPSISGAAVVATDQAARIDKLLVGMHNQFAEKFRGFDKARQDKIYDYIKEANFKSLNDNQATLAGKGFSAEEIDALQDWRKAWDTHFWLENADLGRTLRTQGYELFEDASSNDRFFVKPVGKGTAVKQAYDPATQSVVSLTSQQIDDLYTQGGTIAKFRRPVDFNGTTSDFVINRNTPTSYSRTITDTDQVLNYRPGYYQVKYTAPKYIVQKIKDSNGNVLYEKAVSVAGDTEEGKQMVQRLATQNGISPDDFRVRDDIKEMRTDDDLYWDLQNSSGRVAQRHRGKRLEDSTVPVGGFDSQYVEDPIESSIRAARSLSARVATRDAVETMMYRAMQQYGDYFPKNAAGETRWVDNSNNLIATSSKYESELADARTTVEYVNYLRNGYLNSLDEGTKQVFNAMANVLAEMGSKKGERAFSYLGSGKPTEYLKNGVFQAYIALNPFRQWIIQGHQAVRLMGYNPSYMLTGKLTRDTMAFLNGTDPKIVKFITDSGMLDAVDKSNLVRGALADMADASRPIKRYTGKGLSFIRQIGFDIGEQSNLMFHMLAVRDKYIRAGKNVDDIRVRDEIYSEARAFSYDMNFAGDMPYNQNWAALFLQFFQVPHKAIAQISNRRISRSDRLKLAGTDLVLWGIPAGIIIDNLLPEDVKPKDPEVREALLFGLESYILNGALSKIAGKDVGIDFSSLAPYNMEGFGQLFHNIANEGMIGVIESSPAYSLYLKEGGKMREAFGRAGRYMFGYIDEQQGLPPETFTDVIKGFAEISGGWSNGYKAKLILELGKLPNQKTSEPLLNDEKLMYAAAQLFGFRSQKEMFEWAAIKELNKSQKALQEDWEQMFKSYLKIVTRDGMSLDAERAILLQGALRQAFKDDFKAQEYFNKRLAQEMLSKQDLIIKKGLEYGNIKSASENATALRNLSILKDEKYDNMQQIFEDAQREVNREEE